MSPGATIRRWRLSRWRLYAVARARLAGDASEQDMMLAEANAELAAEAASRLTVREIRRAEGGGRCR